MVACYHDAMGEKLLFSQGSQRILGALRTALQLAAVLLMACGAVTAGAQVLHVETLPNGTELMLVAQPEATATAVAWPERSGGELEVRSIASGELGLASDLASAFKDATEAPPVLIAVGAATPDELRGAASGALGSLPVAPLPSGPAPGRTDEGGTERRLGTPGSQANLRLVLPLPPLEDGRRTAVEILLELAPGLLANDLPGLRSTEGTDTATFEIQVDPAGADLYLERLRRRLAQLGDDTRLDAAMVERARRHLDVRRMAGLEELPTGAERLVRIWAGGGDRAIRQYLFGASGADLAGVREAARTWMPRHPGWATILLPPQSLNPRFAGGPETELLDNGLSVALLERPATPLAVLDLRPVTSSDLAGDRTATVLARLAGALRQADNAPPWIRVLADPPSLLVATAPDGFSEALEAVTNALEELRQDTAPVTSSRDPRHAALGLAAALLGVGDTALTPAALLAPDNLALGAVVPDVERAQEALHKLLDTVQGSTGTVAVNVGGSPRHAVALPGTRSAVAVLLPVAAGTDDVDLGLAAEVLRTRLAAVFGKGATSVLRPAVPGRTVLVVVVEADGTVGAVESRLKESWPNLVAEVGDEELAPLRHRLAAELAIHASGSTGAALRCAAIAAQGGSWRRPEELESLTMAAEPKAVSALLGGFAPWDDLERAVAGPLPVEDLALPKR